MQSPEFVSSLLLLSQWKAQCCRIIVQGHSCWPVGSVNAFMIRSSVVASCCWWWHCFSCCPTRLASRLFETADGRLNSGKRIFMFRSQGFEGNMEDLPPLDPRLNLKLSAGISVEHQSDAGRISIQKGMDKCVELLLSVRGIGGPCCKHLYYHFCSSGSWAYHESYPAVSCVQRVAARKSWRCIKEMWPIQAIAILVSAAKKSWRWIQGMGYIQVIAILVSDFHEGCNHSTAFHLLPTHCFCCN